MKKFLFVSLIFSILLCSCSNNFNSDKKDSGEEGKILLKIASDNTDSRNVLPKEYQPYTNVAEWTVTFTLTASEQNPELASQGYTQTETMEKVDSDAFTLYAGTYNIAVSGKISDTNLYYAGTLTGVEITSVTAPAEATVYVGTKKENTGTLECTITLSTDISSNNFYVNLTNKTTNTTTPSTSLEKALGVKVEKSENTLTLSSSTITSGFYKMDICYKKDTNSAIQYDLDIEDPYFEICDGCTTTVTRDISDYTISRTFYATTSETENDYNGITENYPIYIDVSDDNSIEDFISKLTSDDRYENVNVYFPSSEDLSEKNFSSLKEKGKTVKLYQNDYNFCTDGEYVSDFYVDADGEYENGTTTYDAFTTLYDVSQLISKLYYNDTSVSIHVSGTVTETQESSFTNVQSITISGAAGDPEEDNLDNIVDIFDWGGVDGTNGILFENNDSNKSSEIIKTITFENIKITGANGSKGSAYDQYGGVKFSYVSAAINFENCVFENNVGGSVAESILFISNVENCDAITANLSNCAFKSNGTTANGRWGDDNAGVIHINSCPITLTVDNCTFTNNQKTPIYVLVQPTDDKKAVVEVTNSTFSGNTNYSYDGSSTDTILFKYVSGNTLTTSENSYDISKDNISEVVS